MRDGPAQIFFKALDGIRCGRGTGRDNVNSFRREATEIRLVTQPGGCFAAGMLSLVGYEKWMAARLRRKQVSLGPGAAAVAELRVHPLLGTPARRLALFIAVGIGLHNFSEGLAIGQSAAGDELTLATLLVIGFALHNATEGFGIVAPLASEADRPSWPVLGLLGLIGGGPTFVGTMVGRSWVNDTVSIAFLSLAAGSILTSSSSCSRSAGSSTAKCC